MTFLKRLFFKILRRNPGVEMVQYWKKGESQEAKLYKNPDGSMSMKIHGEKYPFMGYPRGHILFGKLSKLKHEIKNQIFNDSWALLEDGETPEHIIARIKRRIPELYAILDSYKYDIVPPDRLVPPVREIHRAWAKVDPSSWMLRDMLCHVLQEDDSYRMRVQWLVKYFNPNRWYCFKDPVKMFEKALTLLEHAEIISDMKGKQRLLKRILLTILQDPNIRKKFIALSKEIDWKKVALTKADSYFFRGKYFKVDYGLFEY